MLSFNAGVDYQGTLVDVRLIGVCALGPFEYAFVLLKLKDSSSNLSAQLSVAVCENGVWLSTGSGTSATYWTSLGAPPAPATSSTTSLPSFDSTYQGTVIAVGGSIIAYACGNDGNFYAITWNGIWSAWTKCSLVSGGPASIAKVDHVAGDQVCVTDANNQAWVMGYNSGTGSWVGAQRQSSAIWGNTGSPLFFAMGGGYACVLTATVDGLQPRVYTNTGIATNHYVVVTYARSSDSLASPYAGPDGQMPTVCVVGWNPSAPGTLLWSTKQTLNLTPYANTNIDMTQPAMDGAGNPHAWEDGAFCWAMAEGGKLGSAQLGHDYSQANFNYTPNVPNSPSGGNVGFDLTIGGGAGPHVWSFSAANQHV